MQKKALKTIHVIFLLTVTVFVMLSVFAVIVNRQNNNRNIQEIKTISAKGYLPLQNSMMLSGYSEVPTREHTYTKYDKGQKIYIIFDIHSGVCKKNDYIFSIVDSTEIIQETLYIKKEKLESIVNYIFTCSDDMFETIEAQKKTYTAHEWTEIFQPLIAHAGGVMRSETSNARYTNSLESLIQNYDLGHRVFEFDFHFTTDRELAAIHDWKRFGNKDGIVMSSEQWRETGVDANGTRYTSMLIGDILDQMVINKDIFLVTDTKSYAHAAEQFQIIHDEAMRRDSELLDRIIPQIYNREMYSTVTDIYPFQSIIFTLYLTKEKNKEIISFVKKHDDIKVVTMPGYGERMETNIIKKLAKIDKLVYSHSQNTYEDITALINMGVYGIYTDYLIPKDFEIFQSVVSLDTAE